MLEYDLAVERNELLIWQQHGPVSGVWSVTEPVTNARLCTVWFLLSWTSWKRDRNQISGCQGLCVGGRLTVRRVQGPLVASWKYSRPRRGDGCMWYVSV